MQQKSILLILLLISIFTLIITDVVFVEVVEFFSWGYEIGRILSNLSLAFIASYIFYYVVVVLKDKKDRKNINHSVYELNKKLIQRGYSIYYLIIEASGENKDEYDRRSICFNDYLNLCKKANPNSFPKNRILGTPSNPVIGAYKDFAYHNAVLLVKDYMKQVFDYMPFLESDLVKILGKIKNSQFYIGSIAFNMKMQNTDFSVWAKDMFGFLEIIRELEDYNENEIKQQS